MESDFEKQEREAKNYQAQQKGYADDYLKQQDALKQPLTPADVQRNIETVDTPAGKQIAQANSIFQNATPEQQQQFASDFIAQDKLVATQDRLKEYGIGQEEPSKPGGFQMPVEIEKTTNPASVMAQGAYERRMDYLEKDEKFAGQIEAAANDPVQLERLNLQRDLETQQYEMETSHAASNVSRLVGDKENTAKFADLADTHEVQRDKLVNELAEFDLRHPEAAQGQDDQQQAGEQQASKESQQVNQKESPVSEKSLPTAGEKTPTPGEEAIEKIWREESEKSPVSEVSAEQKEMARVTREDIEVADQQQDRGHEKSREQSR